MTKLRLYLALLLAGLSAYTLLVGSRQGWDLLPLFFSSIAAMAWPGQFNLDFLTFLTLAALWVAWRHRFSLPGLALGLAALFGGMIFLATYLLWASARSAGDVHALLLGEDRTARPPRSAALNSSTCAPDRSA